MTSLRLTHVLAALLGLAASAGPAGRPASLPNEDCASQEVRQRPYMPSYDLPNGPQVAALYFGSSTCGPCNAAYFVAALKEMKPMLACQAKATHPAFPMLPPPPHRQRHTPPPYPPNPTPHHH